MVWRDWKKPGKVVLFDFSASSNYILAFITKFKKKSKKGKKKKNKGRERDRQGISIQLPTGKWHFNLSIDPFPLALFFFFPFLILPCKLISLFIMWKDCKQGSPDMGWAGKKPPFCSDMGTKGVATKHWQPSGRNVFMCWILRFQVVLERSHMHFPEHLCTWKVSSCLSSSA